MRGLIWSIEWERGVKRRGGRAKEDAHTASRMNKWALWTVYSIKPLRPTELDWKLKIIQSILAPNVGKVREKFRKIANLFMRLQGLCWAALSSVEVSGGDGLGAWAGGAERASFRSMFEKHHYWEIILLVVYGSLAGQCDQRYGRVTETCNALLAARKTHGTMCVWVRETEIIWCCDVFYLVAGVMCAPNGNHSNRTHFCAKPFVPIAIKLCSRFTHRYVGLHM